MSTLTQQGEADGWRALEARMNGSRKRLVLRALWTTGLPALLLGACDDGATVTGAPPGGGAGEGPLYLVATTFSAGDQDETYLVTSSSFDSTTSIDSTNGPKLLGGIVPTVHGGSVFAPDSTSPVIPRFDVSPDNGLRPGTELSFAGVGMTELFSWHIYIVSDTKGYVFDPAGSRIIVWDPSTMALTGAQIDLPMIVREGWVPNLVFEHSGPVRRGSTLLIPLGWQDLDFNSRYASGVLAIDVDTDRVASVDDDERCGETYATVTGPDGAVYFFPPDWTSAPHFFADLHQPTCVLRVPVGSTTFEDGYALDLSALGSGLAAAGAVPDGASGFLFTSVDEALWDGGNNEGGAFWPPEGSGRLARAELIWARPWLRNERRARGRRLPSCATTPGSPRPSCSRSPRSKASRSRRVTSTTSGPPRRPSRRMGRRARRRRRAPQRRASGRWMRSCGR